MNETTNTQDKTIKSRKSLTIFLGVAIFFAVVIGMILLQSEVSKTDSNSTNTLVEASQENRHRQYRPGEVPLLAESPSDREIVSEMFEEVPLIGTTFNESVTRVDGGVQVEYQVENNLSSVVFWHVDELEEEGWTITSPPDTENNTTQTATATYPQQLYQFEATAISEKLTQVKIIVTSN